MYETQRKTTTKIPGYHQEIYQVEWADGRQHSGQQGLQCDIL